MKIAPAPTKMLAELTKEFFDRLVKWTKLKLRIHTKKEGVKFVKERDIWWAHLGINIGHEQDGKNENFERPVLIVKNMFGGKVLWAVPMTSKEREDGNYFFKTSYIQQPDGASITQYAILPQLKAISPKRLIRKLRVMPKDECKALLTRLRDLLTTEEKNL